MNTGDICGSCESLHFSACSMCPHISHIMLTVTIATRALHTKASNFVFVSFAFVAQFSPNPIVYSNLFYLAFSTRVNGRYAALQRYDHLPVARAARAGLCVQQRDLLLSVWNTSHHVCENFPSVLSNQSDPSAPFDCSGNQASSFPSRPATTHPHSHSPTLIPSYLLSCIPSF
jgi:hypothetical protein